MNLHALIDQTPRQTPRLLIEADLRPLQGSRFQPTGFPDLGAAVFQTPDGDCLLVESVQSMANRMEAVCWDTAESELVAPLRGLPYVVATLPDGSTTNSILEAHRLNSPYIASSDGFAEISEAIGFEKNKPFDRSKLVEALLRFDPNSLVHGIFLEKIGGVVRIPRALSAFIEAHDVKVAPSGGVKIDRVQPASAGQESLYGKAQEGYGNVPYQRDEYTADKITAYFNLDLAQIRGYGLGRDAEDLLIGLALFKILSVLDRGLRLRTACDLELDDGSDALRVKRPDGYALPALDEITGALPRLISACADRFAGENGVTRVIYEPKKKAKK